MNHRRLRLDPAPAPSAEWSLEVEVGRHLSLLPEAAVEERGTAKVLATVLDPAGPPGWMSLTWATSATIPFDDPAVSEALRSRLRGRPADAFSTLIHGDGTLIGSITCVTGSIEREARAHVVDDPFARLLPRWIVAYPAGRLGRTPAPAGPGIQRWGSDQPWPWDRFGAATEPRPSGLPDPTTPSGPRI